MTEKSMVEKCLSELKKRRHIEGVGLIGADGKPYAVTDEDMRAWIRTIIGAMREPTPEMQDAIKSMIRGYDADFDILTEYAKAAWNDMISEALKG